MKVFLILISIILLNSSISGKVDQNKEAIEYAKKGIFEIGGNLSMSHVNSTDHTTFKFGSSFTIDYFIFNNVHLGIRPSFLYEITKFENHPNLDRNQLYLTPFINIGYVFQISKKLYLDLAFGVGFFTLSDFTNSINYFKQVAIDLGPTLKYSLNQTLLNFGLSYYRTWPSKNSSSVKFSSISLWIGFSYYFSN